MQLLPNASQSPSRDHNAEVRSKVSMVVPPDIDINAVVADLHRDGVSAPQTYNGKPLHAQLVKVVEDAHAKGLDLKIVFVPHDYKYPTYMRDLAYAVRGTQSGTVVAIAPHAIGSESKTLSRFVLENGEYNLPTMTPATAAQTFVNRVTAPHQDWTSNALALVVALAIAMVAGRYVVTSLHRRRPSLSTAPGVYSPIEAQYLAANDGSEQIPSV